MNRKSARTPVKRVLLRLPEDLHLALTQASRAEGLSFNEACVRRLRLATWREDTSPAEAVIARADRLFGAHVLGLVALGSVVRGDAAADSDVDLLVVVDSGLELSRELYRRWDAEGVVLLDGRPVDVHFVTLTGAEAPPTAVWCEAAVEGEVWLDRSGRIASRLAGLRRAIAEGRVRRRSVHGHPYWMEVA